jgi:hypothetical protein
VNSSRIVSQLNAASRISVFAVLLGVSSLGAMAMAQEATVDATTAAAITPAPVVPQQVRFTGTLPTRNGDTVEAVFRIYAASEGGEPLWTETQQIAVAQDGSYSVLLGSASAKGLPQAVFGSGQARWVAVAVERGEEEPRIPLASAPYAMKAGDAQTLGGLSAQSFVTHAQLAAAAQALAVQAVQQIAPSVTPTGSGTTDYVPLWTSASNLGNSALYQAGSDIGIGTTAPTAPLHIIGPGTTGPSLVLQGGGGYGALKMGADVNAKTLTPSVRKLARITMPDWAADSLGVTLFSGDVTGANANDLYFGGTPGGSQYAATGLHFVTAANGTTTGGTEQMTLTSAANFGIGTTTPAAKLEVNGTAKFDGNITFASTQTFPVKGTGGGTVTSVASGAGLTGGPITTSGTLGIATAGVTNAMLQNPSLTVTAGSGLSGGGTVALGSATTLSLNPVISATSGSFSANSSPAVSASFGSAYGELGLVFVDGGENSYAAGVDGVDMTGKGYGVIGQSPGGTGVLGNGGSTGAGLYGTGALGVFGTSANGSNGSLATTYGGIPAGVYGDNGTSTTHGMLGTTTNGYQTGVYGTSTTYGVFGSGSTYGTVGESSGYTGVYGSGPSYGVYSDGTIGSSTYSSVAVALPDDRAVEFYSMGSTEQWLEDFGSAKLQDGVATVPLDSTFAMAVNGEVGYHVFLTPNGECEGLYVAGKTAAGFEVRELHGGQSNVEFDFRIVAKRRGFEGMRMAQLQADAETLEQIRDRVRSQPTHRTLILRKPLPNDLKNATPQSLRAPLPAHPAVPPLRTQPQKQRAAIKPDQIKPDHP